MSLNDFVKFIIVMCAIKFVIKMRFNFLTHPCIHKLLTMCQIIDCYGCYGIWPHNRLWQPRIWTWDRLFIAMGAMDNDLLMNYEIFTDDLVWLLVKLIIAMGAMKFVIKMRMAYHLCEFIHALSKCFIFTIPCQTCRNLQRILIDALHVWHLNGYHLFEWIHAP